MIFLPSNIKGFLIGKTERLKKTRSTMTERGRRRYVKIIEKATELFLKQGYEATSVNEIIHEAGGSLSTAYQSFQNKEGLFRAVLESVVQEIKERYITFQLEGIDYRESIKHILTHIYENMFNPKISRLLILALQIESLREKTVKIMYRELFEPLLHIMTEIEKRYELHFVFGVEETLLCILRHIRGSVMEFMFCPEKWEENKRQGIEQTMAIFIRLIDISDVKTKENKAKKDRDRLRD